MKFNDERLIFGSRISDRIIRDNNQQLLCNDCILSRTGYYEYLESEIMHDGDPNKIVKVFRTEKEVFDPKSIASFENKPLCDDHPDEDVTLANYKDLQKGFIKNVRRGTGKYIDCLLCDIVVTDEETIDKILSREKRELSAGYDARIIKDDNGEYQMVDIRGNHLALVNSGRAGCATIRDSASRFINNNGGKVMSLFDKKAKKTKTRLFDGDIVEVEEILNDDDITEETPVEEPVAQPETDFQAQLDALRQRVEALEAKCASTEVTDEEEVPTEEVEEETISDNDEEVMEENYEEEVISDDEEEIVEEETEEIVEEDGDVEELIDADEVSEDEETEEEVKPVKDSKATKVQNTYAKFATNLKDSKVQKSKSVQISFQERYNRASRG